MSDSFKLAMNPPSICCKNRLCSRAMGVILVSATIHRETLLEDKIPGPHVLYSAICNEAMPTP
eukprot:m.74824 g.74824  ORF g.74824 m.74824 type:complete len:63 (+) comp10345_c0_seq1:1454-1642(+)